MHTPDPSLSRDATADVTTPVTAQAFADLGVPADMVRRLADRGIDAPFPIQAATIPDALAGRDICGRAPTGSGKTIAFGIPMVHRLSGAKRLKGRRPRGLVLVPTRELAAQVHQELVALTPANGLWVDVVYGGVGFDKQIKNARNGIDVVVACPGRLADLINQGYLHLDEVELVVIDEADRMADMGFLPEVKRLLDRCRSDRQTLLFSATLDGDVNQLIKNYQHNPARHELDVDERVDARAEHHFWNVDLHGRVQAAAGIVDRVGPTVVFCRTKHGADRVAKQLDQAGIRAASIHGGRSQGQRDRALASFHNGGVAALVATDVAARGIHVDNVAAVVHFDPPADHKDYVHRSGRTARAGAAGVVVSLVAPAVRKQVTDLQKKLELPRGITAPDLELLVERDRPGRRAPVAAAPAVDDRPASKREWEDRRPPARDRQEPKAKREWEDRRPAAPRPERTERPARTERTDRAERTDRPVRNERTPVETVDGGSTGIDGDDRRRPSGAARRKAKRLSELTAPATRDDYESTSDRRPATPRPAGQPNGKSKHRGTAAGTKARPKNRARNAGPSQAGARRSGNR